MKVVQNVVAKKMEFKTKSVLLQKKTCKSVPGSSREATSTSLREVPSGNCTGRHESPSRAAVGGALGGAPGAHFFLAKGRPPAAPALGGALSCSPGGDRVTRTVMGYVG